MRINDNLNNIKELNDILSLAPVANDIVTSLIGEEIGSGVYRTTYVYNLDHSYVIKAEPLNTQCNVVEYLLWQEIKELSGSLEWVKDWFAPVKWISPNGRLLVMKRTKQIKSRKKPDKVPKFLWDVKEDNFGWIDGKYVCHDYGQFYNFINYPKGMKSIEW